MDQHVVAVSGRVVCLVVSTRTTTGVIMTTTERCDCIDYDSKQTSDRRHAAHKERARWDKLTDDMRVRVRNFTITDE
jgi:hypothetical protein